MIDRRVVFPLVTAAVLGSGVTAQDIETRMRLEYALGQANSQVLQAQMQVAELDLSGTRLVLARALNERLSLPAEQWFPADSADELFRRARAELRSRNYQAAADLFRELRKEFPQSAYLGRSMYWEAFALNRLGGQEERRRAVTLLDELIGEDPDLSDQAASLRIQVLGRLGRQGDAEAAAQVVSAADVMALRGRLAGQAVRPVIASRPGYRQNIQESEDVRLQALNALLQMDSENAMPILRRLLQNRADDNVELRRRAIFLVAQKRGDGREEILLDAARNDPDDQVREQAVFHLSQVRTDAAVDALDSILQYSTEARLQERAIFALAQHRSDRAGEILERFVRRADAPANLRASAVQWIGQRRGSGVFLRELYAELTDNELKEKVFFAISQRREPENAQFLLGIAVDGSETVAIRKQALFWAGQMRIADAQLYQMYDQVSDPEMKEQLIFVYGQRRDSLAVNQLIEIARDASNVDLQGKAIFWLGQSRDPRAIAVLEEIINREDDR